MAQGDEGAPRKSKTYRDFSGMNSQNERYKIGDDEFFWMENIMRVGPRKLHSVPGPTPPLSFFPVELGCPPDTFPGSQTLTLVDCFRQSTGIPNGTMSNVRANWGFVGNHDEIISLLENASFVPPTTQYPNPGKYQVIHWINGVGTSVTPIPPPSSGSGGNCDSINIGPGHSDELSYCYEGHDAANLSNWFIYFSWPKQTATSCRMRDADPAGYDGLKNWAKEGNNIYEMVISSGAPANNYLLDFDATTGAFNQKTLLFTAIPGTILRSINAVGNLIYVLRQDTTDDYTLYRVNRSDLSIASTTTIPNPPSGSLLDMFVVSDSAAYFITGTNFVYWSDLSGSPVTTVDTFGKTDCGQLTSFPNMNWLWFRDGFIYYGNGGFSGSSVDIAKLGTLLCPPDFLVPIGQT